MYTHFQDPEVIFLLFIFYVGFIIQGLCYTQKFPLWVRNNPQL